MYKPESRPIQSWQSQVRPQGPDMDWEGTKSVLGAHLDAQKKKYEETDDLYDMQASQAKAFDETLAGLQGKDYEYQQTAIIKHRDDLANLYKGKTLKETKTPEFQKKLYDIQSSLSGIRNKVATSGTQISEAKRIAEKTPSFIREEVDKYLMQQAQLPPDQRDENILEKVTTDPLFFNAYDYSLGIMKDLEKQKFNKDRVTGREIQHWEHDYYADLGSYNAKGQFEYKVSDSIIDAHLANPVFYKKMEGMIPAPQAMALRKQGNDMMMRDAVKEQTAKFLQGIKALEPQVRLKSSRALPQPSSSDQKENKHNRTVNAIMGRILSGDPTALDAYKSDHWAEFKLQKNGDEVTGVLGFPYETKGLLKKKTKSETPVFFPITSDAFQSVENLLAQVKFTSQGDKEKVEITDEGSAPTPQPSAVGGGWANDF